MQSLALLQDCFRNIKSVFMHLKTLAFPLWHCNQMRLYYNFIKLKYSIQWDTIKNAVLNVINTHPGHLKRQLSLAIFQYCNQRYCTMLLLKIFCQTFKANQQILRKPIFYVISGNCKDGEYFYNWKNLNNFCTIAKEWLC